MRQGWLTSLFSPAEHAVLRLSALTPPRPNEAVTPLSNASSQHVIEIARQGKLLPILGWKLNQEQSSDRVVKELFQGWTKAAQRELRVAYQHAWVLAERRKIFMRQIRQSLRSHEIPYALHKGMGYISSLYPDDAIRLMNDVDLVINPEDKQKVRSLMEKQGLEYMVLEPPHPCAQLFRRNDQRFYLDVHHRISWPYQTNIPTKGLVKQATLLSTEDDRVFGPTAQFLFHIYHMCKEQLLKEHTPLRAFMELRELYLKLQDSLSSVKARAKRWGLYRMLCCGLWLLALLFPGLLSPNDIPSTPVIKNLVGLIRYTERQQRWQALQTLLRGLFLLATIDHPSHQIAYLQQRIYIEVVKKR